MARNREGLAVSLHATLRASLMKRRNTSGHKQEVFYFPANCPQQESDSEVRAQVDAGRERARKQRTACCSAGIRSLTAGPCLSSAAPTCPLLHPDGLCVPRPRHSWPFSLPHSGFPPLSIFVVLGPAELASPESWLMWTLRKKMPTETAPRG